MLRLNNWLEASIWEQREFVLHRPRLPVKGSPLQSDQFTTHKWSEFGLTYSSFSNVYLSDFEIVEWESSSPDLPLCIRESAAPFAPVGTGAFAENPFTAGSCTKGMTTTTSLTRTSSTTRAKTPTRTRTKVGGVSWQTQRAARYVLYGVGFVLTGLSATSLTMHSLPLSLSFCRQRPGPRQKQGRVLAHARALVQRRPRDGDRSAE